METQQSTGGKGIPIIGINDDAYSLNSAPNGTQSAATIAVNNGSASLQVGSLTTANALSGLTATAVNDANGNPVTGCYYLSNDSSMYLTHDAQGTVSLQAFIGDDTQKWYK